MKRRYVMLFGQMYVWRRDSNGRLCLEPNWDSYLPTGSTPPSGQRRRKGAPPVSAFGVALVVAYLVAFGALLWKISRPVEER